ncbi:DNA-binding protein [Candidatus Bathyarchaeota archaeon]|nr:DNA-binding protein [Candidatus Bathyarchaeota archaeon]
MADDDELEEIRKKKMQQLQNESARRQQEEAIKQQVDQQRQVILRRILSPEARQRLANIKLARPQFAEAIESQLIQIAQTGQIRRLGVPVPLSDQHFKQILTRLSGSQKKKDFRIRKI